MVMANETPTVTLILRRYEDSRQTELVRSTANRSWGDRSRAYSPLEQGTTPAALSFDERGDLIGANLFGGIGSFDNTICTGGGGCGNVFRLKLSDRGDDDEISEANPLGGIVVKLGNFIVGLLCVFFLTTSAAAQSKSPAKPNAAAKAKQATAASQFLYDPTQRTEQPATDESDSPYFKGKARF